MGMREDVLALAEDVEATVGGCGGCLLDKCGLCEDDTGFECQDEICKFVAHRLRAIAEKDAGDVATVSAYDLLPDEDRKAIAWVREHGGIAEVKDEWKRRNNLKRRLEKAQDKVGRQQRHIEELQRKLAERRDGINAMRSQMGEMSKRLMPEGMEWPTVDGKPVEVGERLVGYSSGDDGYEVVGVRPSCGWVLVKAYDNVLNVNGHAILDGPVILEWDASKCHRPAPKVVDADGVEIRVGDTVWTDYGDGPWTVTKITTAHAWHVYGHSDEMGSLDMQPNLLTHRAPVLAADGKPLREGETAWDVESGTEYEVVSIYIDEENPVRVMRTDGSHLAKATKPSTLSHQRPVLDADGVPIKKGDTVYVAPFDDPLTVRGFAADGRVLMDYHSDDSFGYRPERLTHAKPEPPDTWERIEEDCSISERQYYAQRIGHDVGLKDDEEVHVAVSRDLVRRCRALAERGE